MRKIISMCLVSFQLSNIMDLNVFLTPIKILKGFGLWQNKNASRFYAVYGIFMLLTHIGLSTLFQFLYVIDIKTTDQLLHFLTFCPTFVDIFIKSLILMTKIEAIEELLTSMKELMAKIKSPEKYERQTNAFRKFYKTYLAIALIATLFGAYSSLALRILPFKMWLPFDAFKSSLSFFLVAGLANATLFGFCAIGASLNFTPVIFMKYAAIFLNDLCERIATQQTDADDKDLRVESRKRFLQLIEEHLEIKHFIEKATNVFAPFLLVQGLCCSTILCAISYSLTVSFLTKQLCQILTFVF